jgi:hypothetical protein
MTSATLPFETALRSDSEIKRYPTFRQLSVEKPDFTVAYVMAALLGCVCGIAIAVYSGSGLNLSTLFNSEISSTGAADVIAPETTVAGKDFPLASQAVKQESTASASLLTVAVYKSAANESISLPTEVSPAVPTHHATHKASARLHLSTMFRRSLRHRTSKFNKMPQIADQPQTSETAKTVVLVAAQPASFMIEGDVTVADYDALAGMIETREGKTFTVAKAMDESSGIPWADSLSSVHYRCDQSGNCTLFHGGWSVSNARMTGPMTGI